MKKAYTWGYGLSREKLCGEVEKQDGLADGRLRATPEQLSDALCACTELNAVYRPLLKMALEELRLIDEQIGHWTKRWPVCSASSGTYFTDCRLPGS